MRGEAVFREMPNSQIPFSDQSLVVVYSAVGLAGVEAGKLRPLIF